MEISKLTHSQILDLLRILKDSNDTRLRIKVRQELIELDQRILVEILSKIINTEVDAEVLAYAAELIVDSDDKEKAHRILPLIRFADPALRQHVCGLLGNCNDDLAIDPLVERLQKDESVDVRIAAAYALGKIGNKRALKVLNWAKDHDFSADFEGRTVSEISRMAIDEITHSA